MEGSLWMTKKFRKKVRNRSANGLPEHVILYLSLNLWECLNAYVSVVTVLCLKSSCLQWMMRLVSRSRPTSPSLGLGTTSRPPGICSGGGFCKAADWGKDAYCIWAALPEWSGGSLYGRARKGAYPRSSRYLDHLSTKQSSLPAYMSQRVTMQSNDTLSLCGLIRAEHRSCGMSSGRGHPVPYRMCRAWMCWAACHTACH